MTKSTVRTRLDIIKQLSEEFGISAEQARNIVRFVLDNIIDAAIENGRMEIRRFGTFKITHRAARVARNPRTNQQMRIPPRYVLTFEPSEIVLEKVAQHYRVDESIAGESRANASNVSGIGEKKPLQDLQDNRKFPFEAE